MSSECLILSIKNMKIEVAQFYWSCSWMLGFCFVNISAAVIIFWSKMRLLQWYWVTTLRMRSNLARFVKAPRFCPPPPPTARSSVRKWWTAWGSPSISPYPWSSCIPTSRPSSRRSARPSSSSQSETLPDVRLGDAIFISDFPLPYILPSAKGCNFLNSDWGKPLFIHVQKLNSKQQKHLPEMSSTPCASICFRSMNIPTFSVKILRHPGPDIWKLCHGNWTSV